MKPRTESPKALSYYWDNVKALETPSHLHNASRHDSTLPHGIRVLFRDYHSSKSSQGKSTILITGIFGHQQLGFYKQGVRN